MLNIRIVICLMSFAVLMAACTGNQESQHQKSNSIQVEQSSFQSDNMMTRSDIADHLANLALKINDVEDAASLVVGPYTVVGINISEDVERQRTSTIKYAVLEALEHDPYGREAIVIADADMPARLRGMREAIQNGAPVKGVADELANIVSRYMPTVPIEDLPDKEDLPDEKPSEETGP